MAVNQYKGLKQTQKLSYQITRHGQGAKLTADKDKHRHKITGHRWEQSGQGKTRGNNNFQNKVGSDKTAWKKMYQHNLIILKGDTIHYNTVGLNFNGFYIYLPITPFPLFSGRYNCNKLNYQKY